MKNIGKANFDGKTFTFKLEDKTLSVEGVEGVDTVKALMGSIDLLRVGDQEFRIDNDPERLARALIDLGVRWEKPFGPLKLSPKERTLDTSNDLPAMLELPQEELRRRRDEDAKDF